MLALERLFRSLRRTLKRSYPNTSLTKKITQSAGLYEFLLIRSYRDGYSALHIFSTALSGARKNCLFETPRLKITSLFLPFRRTLKRSHPDTSLTKKQHSPLDCVVFLVGGDGFEPSKRDATDLQSAPLGHAGTLPKNGAGDGTRTRDLLITNQLLYQLSYTSLFCVILRRLC